MSWGFVGGKDHSVTETSGLDYFDSGYAPPDRIEYSMVFPVAGSFPYHCKDPNHASSMHGVVHVKVGRTPAFDGDLGHDVHDQVGAEGRPTRATCSTCR